MSLVTARLLIAQFEEDERLILNYTGKIPTKEGSEFINVTISEFPVLLKPNAKFNDICQNLGKTLWTSNDNPSDKYPAFEEVLFRSCIVYSLSKNRYLCANLLPAVIREGKVQPSSDEIETYTSLFTGKIIGKIYIRFIKGHAMFYSNLFYNVEDLKDKKVQIGFSDILESITSQNLESRCLESSSFKSISKNISIGGYNDIEEKISAIVAPIEEIGKSLVIQSTDSQILACADIVKEAGKKVIADIDMDNVQMKIEFTQNSRFENTKIDVKLSEKCLDNKMTIQINQFPIEQGLDANNKCSESNVGTIFDPFQIYDEQIITPTIISCSAGNVVSFIDNFRTLYGTHSIVGRSISIINGDGSKRICGNIGYPGEVTTAVVQFRTNPVYGEMYIRQGKNNWMSETSISIKLANYNNQKTENHNFHIHVTKVQNNSICSQANGHYNPLKVDVVDKSYKERCKVPFRCEFGDLSMKHGAINIDASLTNSQSKIFITDEYVDLSGPFSVMDRSVVIHQGKGRLACANILQLHPRQVTTQFKKLNMELKLKQNSPFDSTEVSFIKSNLTFTPSVMKVLQVNADIDNSGKYKCSNLEKLETYSPYLNASGSGDLNLSFEEMTQSSNLPLFNQLSVSGRGVIITSNQPEDKSDCGSLEETSVGSAKATATVTFNKEIEGTIKFSQLIYENGAESITNVAINLNMKNKSEVSNNHKFHVHVKPISPVEGCAEAKGHYNPFGAAIGTSAYKQCTKSNTLACELGDLSKKYGLLHLNAPAYYNDINLPLTGPNSIIGRSIVIHSKNNGASRYDCANIIPPSTDVYEICFSITQKYDYFTFIESLSNGLEISPNQIVPLHNKQVPIAINKNCHCVLAYIIAPLSKEKKQSFMNGSLPLKGYSTGYGCNIQQSIKLLGKESQVFSGGLILQPYSTFYFCFLTFMCFLFA